MIWSATSCVAIDAAEWPRPARVGACFTTRVGDLNLGLGVGEPDATVWARRRSLQEHLGLGVAPAWLRQVHGTEVVRAVPGEPVEADAAWSATADQACVVMMADCLPVLFCDDQGSVVAAAHAGWRGLRDGVLQRTIAAMQRPAASLHAWIGPGIGPQAFEVGPEVRDAFVARDARNTEAFAAGREDRWLADLRQLARRTLWSAGVGRVYGAPRCTFSEPERFYSFRREPACGRMAALIWLHKETAIACP